MELVEYNRDQDWYAVVAPALTCVRNHYDFPNSLVAFAESLPTSNLAVVDGNIFFRKRNQHMKLITYQCSPDRLRAVLKGLRDAGFILSSLSLENLNAEGLPCVKGEKRWHGDATWSRDAMLAQHSHHHRKQLRRVIKTGTEELEIDLQPLEEEVWDVYATWVANRKATPGYGMVIIGHAKRLIERYYQYEPQGMTFMGCRRVSDGKLVGLIGMEHWLGAAEISLCKHYFEGVMPGLAKYMWMNALDMAICLGADYIYAGCYSNPMKRMLRLQPVMSYKVWHEQLDAL